LRTTAFRMRIKSMAISMFVLGSVCVSTPASADILDNFFSVFEPTNEQEIGAEQHPRIVEQFGGEYIQEGLNDYVLDIGLRLAFVSEMKTMPWRFTILNTPVVNAFALPGGFVYITRGLLALANNEAEVAGVLAHEIGHVTARHGAERQSRATGIGLLGALAGILTGSGAVQQLGQQVGGLYIAGYSRDQEHEADQLGVKYLGLAGYPREAMADFLKRMQAQTEYSKKLAGNEGKESQFDFFASHPHTEDRVARAVGSASANADNVEREFGESKYLSEIDGMLYGDDPKEGLIKGREFVHPVLRFKFEAPKGFQLINSSRAVFAVDGKGSQMIFDLGQMKDQSLTMAQYMKSEWLPKYNLQNILEQNINGAPSAVTKFYTENNGKRLYITTVVIDFGGGRVARFIYRSQKPDKNLELRYQESFNSFRPLQYAEAQKIKPTVMEIKTVSPDQSVSDIANGMADIVDDKEGLFLLLNPKFEDGAPIQGQLYKSVRFER
jgi:predicted Zn-dependent protease